MTAFGAGGGPMCLLVRSGWGVETNLKGMGWSSRFVWFEVGDGSRIRFWHDVYCGDQTFKEALPVLFSIARHKEALVAYHVQFSNDSLKWNVTFI